MGARREPELGFQGMALPGWAAGQTDVLSREALYSAAFAAAPVLG